ncbi:hypothetical protein AB7M74_008470 [Bradyrhizobium japonicum]
MLPKSAVASTSLSGAQLLFGLPPTRPPRPAGEGDDGLHLWWVHAGQGDGSPASGGLADHDHVLWNDPFLGGHVVDDPEIDLGDCEARIMEVGVRALSNLGKEWPIERALGNVDGRGAIAAADRRDHEIAALGEPLCSVAEFHQREEASIGRIERYAVVHDHQRERAVADRAHQIGEHRQRQRQGPDLLLEPDFVLSPRWGRERGQNEQGGRQGSKRYSQKRAHRDLLQPVYVAATTIGPSTVSNTLPTA